MLVQELERNLLRGEQSAGNDLILQELRRTIRADAQRCRASAMRRACSSRRSSRF